MKLWPQARRRGHSDADLTPAPQDLARPDERRAVDTRPEPVGHETADWQSLPPIQRSVSTIGLITSVHFEDTLRSWRDPTQTLSPLRHEVGRAAPSGEVGGLLTPQARSTTVAEPGASPVVPDLPVATRPDLVVQRRSDASRAQPGTGGDVGPRAVFGGAPATARSADVRGDAVAPTPRPDAASASARALVRPPRLLTAEAPVVFRELPVRRQPTAAPAAAPEAPVGAGPVGAGPVGAGPVGEPGSGPQHGVTFAPPPADVPLVGDRPAVARPPETPSPAAGPHDRPDQSTLGAPAATNLQRLVAGAPTPTPTAPPAGSSEGHRAPGEGSATGPDEPRSPASVPLVGDRSPAASPSEAPPAAPPGSSDVPATAGSAPTAGPATPRPHRPGLGAPIGALPGTARPIGDVAGQPPPANVGGSNPAMPVVQTRRVEAAAAAATTTRSPAAPSTGGFRGRGPSPLDAPRLGPVPLEAPSTASAEPSAPLVGERPVLDVDPTSGVPDRRRDEDAPLAPGGVSVQLLSADAPADGGADDLGGRPFGFWPWRPVTGAPAVSTGVTGGAAAANVPPAAVLRQTAPRVEPSGTGQSIVRPSSLEPYVQLPPVQRARADVAGDGRPLTELRGVALAPGAGTSTPSGAATSHGDGPPPSTAHPVGRELPVVRPDAEEDPSHGAAGASLASPSAGPAVQRSVVGGPPPRPHHTSAAGPRPFEFARHGGMAPVQGTPGAVVQMARNASIVPSRPAALPASSGADASAGTPTVQRFFGGLMSDVGAMLFHNSAKQADKPKEETATTAPEKPAGDPEISVDGVRRLAGRLYPYISARLKAELTTDRERAGMTTGLHR